MPTDLPLQCACGSVRGTAIDVSPQRGNRLVCMCDDCQAFAHWLERAPQVLDDNGGTDIYQMTPAQLRITEGADQVRCMRLSSKGLMRWYAGCCKTPIANTLASPRAPFTGVVHAFMDHQGDGRSRGEVLGPVRVRVQGRFGRGELPPGTHPRAPLGFILRFMGRLLGGALRRAHRPSPFFDDAGRPVAPPTILSESERQRLRERVTA